MAFLEGFECLQFNDGAPEVSVSAIDFAGQMARQLGARVLTSDAFSPDGCFLGRGKHMDSVGDPIAWAKENPSRILLVAGGQPDPRDYADVSAVLLTAASNASEASCFAESAIAELLGDPEHPPLIPRGRYAAGTAGYGVIAAACALATKVRRFADRDVAVVDLAGTLAWVNWKAASLGEMGHEMSRQGVGAEWPVIPCADGFIALVYQERDWPAIIRMTGDERLRDEKFSSFKGRAIHRDAYMQIIRDWSLGLSKREIMALFLEYEIPAAPVMTEADLLSDALLVHREAFSRESRSDGATCQSPRLAHRVAQTSSAGEANDATPGSGLPLAGMRILDLGIITAGAGVGALLADLGAEVLKVESDTYPDPFRQWAGTAVSPLFKCNNRNKFGIALDLKTDDGKAKFLELVKTADVVLENFRRGVLDRLGLDYATLKSVNPSIVLASISGQGLDGPGSEASSFGSTLEASSGFSACTQDDDGLPYITGRNLNYPDQTVVLYAAAVVTAALADRSRGMHLDVSQRDVAVYLAGETIEQISAGAKPNRPDNGGCYQSSDGRWIAVSTPIDGESTADVVAGLAAEAAVDELTRRGISAARVNSGAQMLAQFEASYQFARSPNGDLVKGFPFQFQRTPMSISLNSPAVGEHTDQFVDR